MWRRSPCSLQFERLSPFKGHIRPSSSIGTETSHKPSSLLDSPGLGPFLPLPLELVLDMHVGKIEVDRRRLETVVAQDLLQPTQSGGVGRIVPMSGRGPGPFSPSWTADVSAGRGGQSSLPAPSVVS